MPENNKNNQDDQFSTHDDITNALDLSFLQLQDLSSITTDTSRNSTPHDKAFKACFEEPRVVAEFFQIHLPEKIFKLLNMATLRPYKENFLDIKFKQKSVDQLFMVDFEDNTGSLLVHVEHQSHAHKHMALRMFEYTIAIIRHIHEQDTHAPYHVVIPLIFYHGDDCFQPMGFFDYFGEHAGLAREIMTNPCQIIDVKKIPDEVLLKHPWAGAMELMFKYANDEHFYKKFQNLITPTLKWLNQNGGTRLIDTVLFYFGNCANVDNRDEFVEYVKHQITDDKGNNMVSMFESCRREGWQEGILEGRQEGRQEGLSQGYTEGQKLAAINIAKELLSDGFDKERVARITKLPLSEIDILCKTADTEAVIA